MKNIFSHSPYKQDQGMALLVVVVVIGALALIVVKSALFLGIDEIDGAHASARGSVALSIAQGCLDEGMLQLARNQAYVGSSLSTDQGSCVIIVTGTGATRRIVSYASTIDSYYKKIASDVAIAADGTLTRLTWQEESN